MGKITALVEVPKLGQDCRPVRAGDELICCQPDWTEWILLDHVYQVTAVNGCRVQVRDEGGGLSWHDLSCFK